MIKTFVENIGGKFWETKLKFNIKFPKLQIGILKETHNLEISNNILLCTAKDKNYSFEITPDGEIEMLFDLPF
jgi:hypothetical protein